IWKSSIALAMGSGIPNPLSSIRDICYQLSLSSLSSLTPTKILVYCGLCVIILAPLFDAVLE
ncbi:hypothetical protein, partial [Enterobacter hormaechei]|uniref:hypothetical protein n=1 Tax=Enterobacter hormaechei TaxID=158836 RepID=UPI001952F08C